MPKNVTDKLFLTIIIVLVLVLAAIFVYYLIPLKNQIQEPAQEQEQAEETTLGASLAYIEGAVEYKEPEGEWKRADQKINLYEGYSVEVIGEGKAIINIDDGSAIRLNSDTTVVLESMDPNSVIIKASKGEVYSRIVLADRTFEIKTADLVYESLGTAYKITCTEDKKGVEVYESKVKIIKDNEEIVVEEGEKYYEENKDNPDEEKAVKEITKEDIENDEFILWNKQQDEESSEYKDHLGILDLDKLGEDAAKVASEQTENPTGAKITLSASATSNGISFSWTLGGINITDGFKIVKSASPDPVYPGNNHVYLSDSKTRSYTWDIMDGNTYYFRVCQYLDGKCGIYSNNVKVTASKKETTKEDKQEIEGTVNLISLSSLGNGNLKWSVDGYSDQGFKVVWSKNSEPIYPCRSGDKYLYYSNPQTTSANITAFEGSGTYYARVCEYLGGKCGKYSNEVTIELTSEKDTSQETGVNSISLSGSGSNISWSVDGYSKSGYKIVWSKNSLPTYPCRSGDKYIYLSSSDARSTALDAFDGSGTYYVRVCEYLGGSCGVYSNQIIVEL